MKALRLFAAAAIMLAASACQSIAGGAIASAGQLILAPSPAITATADKVQIEGARALILADNAYQAAVAIAGPIVASGKLSPAAVDRAEKLEQRAYDLLQKGDAGLTVAQRAAAVFAIRDDLLRTVGR